MRRYVGLFVCACLILLWSLTSGSTANACTLHGLATIDELVKAADVVVKARIVQLDDYQQNAILRVESYLVGTGAEYLLFSQTHPIRVLSFSTNLITIDACEAMANNLTLGDTIYTMLKRGEDGSFKPSLSAYVAPTTFKFPHPTAKLTYQTGYQQERDFTEHQFVQHILNVGRSSVKPPVTNKSFPLNAPLLITTAKGSHYVLPVDGETPVKVSAEQLGIKGIDDSYLDYRLPNSTACTTNNCTGYSPHGLYTAVLVENKVYLCGNQYISRGAECVSPTSSTEGIDGVAFTFAPRNDAILIVRKNRLEVYSPAYIPHYSSAVKSLFSVQLNNDNSESLPILPVWTPDGKAVAYSDIKGVWLWHVYEPSIKPQLILSTEKEVVPEPLEFSALGNYLRVKMASESKIVNMMTREFLPDGLVSPDEQHLLMMNDEIKAPKVCKLHSEKEQCDEIYFMDTENISLFSWKNPGTVYVTACASGFTSEGLLPCEMSLIEVNIADRETNGVNSFHVIGELFTIEANSGMVASVKNKTSVWVNNTEYNLSQHLDGDIKQIQWLPSLMYEGLPSAYSRVYSWNYLSKWGVAK